jgi:ABC-2 type transport system ATP-binding protein
VEHDGKEWIIHLEEDTSSNEMLSQLIAQGVPVKGFNEILPSLNDIFIRLVNGSQSASRQFQTIQS